MTKAIEEMTAEELEEYEAGLNKEIKFRDLKKKQEELNAEKAKEEKDAKVASEKLAEEQAYEKI